MIERVIENWLDNVNERGYEMAFCQALAAQGHTILRRPAHGSTEHGKDIVSRDHRGRYHCYQLKTGNLTKSDWRAIRDEVAELVEVPIQESTVPQGAKFTPHLVTNGGVSDPVSIEITARNGNWKRRGYTPLDLILKDHLFRTFLDVQGRFLPSTPTDFEAFLRLYLGDKRAPLDRELFCSFLTSLFPLGRKYRSAALRRTLAATAILSSYILSGYQESENRLALAEGWMLVLAHMLHLAEQERDAEEHWIQSVALCRESWEAAVHGLVDEALASPGWVEGEPIVDQPVHGVRGMLILGYLAAHAIYERGAAGRTSREDEILAKVKSNLPALSSGYWGESASPFVFAVVLFLWLRAEEELAVRIAADLVRLIARENHPKQRVGVPDPYYGPASLLKPLLGEEVFGHRQSFAGRSFTMQWFIEFLARRGRKQRLKFLWYEITYIDAVSFVPEEPRDLYLWRVKKGAEIARRWGCPHKWEDLVEESNRGDVPKLLLTERFPHLTLPFLLVYPHRGRPELMRLVERAAADKF